MVNTKCHQKYIKKIIEEAHKKGLRVAAHVYYLSDLRQLLNDGLDIVAHEYRRLCYR